MNDLIVPRMHPTIHRFRHLRDGEVIWEQDWTENALADEGEQDILEVYFEGASGPAGFHYGLVNDTPVETDGLGDLSGEPSTNGYARQAVARNGTDFTGAADAGDWKVTTKTVTFTADGGVIGPVTYAILATTSDNSGLLVSYVALSAERTLQDGDSLEATMAIKLS